MHSINTHKSDSLYTSSLFNTIKEYPSQSMDRVINKLINQKFKSTNTLIVGEFGSGKKRTARMLHEISDRSEGPFYSLNCELLENDEAHREFFGYAGYPENSLHPPKSAYERSHRGTLYIENFNQLNQDLQYTLIRTQTEGTSVRIGTTTSKYTDVRFIFGIRPLVYHNFESFRRKTRLEMNMISLFLPPLRERKKDIPVLAKKLLSDYNQKYNRSVEEISPDVMLKLYNYDWPGNVQQLKNTIQQAICVATGSELQLQDLPEYLLDKKLTRTNE